MKRVVEAYVLQDEVSLIPMERQVWDQQILLLGLDVLRENGSLPLYFGLVNGKKADP